MTDLTAENYLPHRGKMMLINTIVHVDSDSAVTESTANNRWPLFSGTGISPIIIVELAAQTAGIYIAWNKEKQKQRTGRERGWVVGISSASFFIDKIQQQSTLVTRITSKISMDTYMKLIARTFIKDDLAGEIGLQLFWEESAET